ncbi:MAG: hypothetical protein A3D44_00555 [Candidatus Staskawiczbacteria bacterium RIFCSPHIGHO2_02_FULL_42_22]|uniref:EfeO-type cupredoxin-like domain-containing protein n=1 Tax=Candidatus Staskawiczbacteria bacterium RIFCSPHIGHO2_02_FULL_42_22 TaxID=1802207 RepID=A0A1G2I2Y3_9BACT|nr:MAG: hypothetical protein A3D44_00555 [Candidatus Staskawiczbacteria bacterium RIFCSPHIGHO2_02_FULL_42_22]
MSRNLIIAIVIVVVLVGGYFLFQANVASQTPSQQPAVTENTDTTTNTPPETSEPVTEIPKTHEVIYTDSGYSPSSLTIKAGDTVTFKNQSSAQIWTGSAMHPVHAVYSGTTLQQHCPDVENDDFDECKGDASGTSWSFTFNKTGSWGYHNHVNSSHFGKIIVQ